MNSITAPADCPTCKRTQTVVRDEDGFADVDTVPCQGAAPDACTKRLCTECRIRCSGCGLHACEEHMGYVGDDYLCHNCIALLIADGAEELTECDQATAETLHLLASADCTSAGETAMTRSDGAVFPISPQSDDSALPKGSAGDSRYRHTTQQSSGRAVEHKSQVRCVSPRVGANGDFNSASELTGAAGRTETYSRPTICDGLPHIGVNGRENNDGSTGRKQGSDGRNATSPDTGVRPLGLSPRESQVMDLLAEGLAYKETAHALNISGHTVKAYLQSCREKLDARNSTHAAAIWTAMKFKRAA